MPLTFTVNGQQVTAEQFEAMAQKRSPESPKTRLGTTRAGESLGTLLGPWKRLES